MNILRSFLILMSLFKVSHQVLEWMDGHVEKVKDWSLNDCSSNKIPFTNRQRNYCKRNLGYMEFISKSIRMIKNECRVAFVRERWNCDTILNAPRFDSSIKTATKESAAVQALAAAQVLHTSINDCTFKGLCPKCKDRPEIVAPNARRAKGEEKLEKIIHQSGACEEMFPGPLNFIKRFMKIGRRKMENYRKTWPERYGQEEINFHNKQVGLQVAYETRSPRCYCPGIFPICYTKICYTAMDVFSKVGRKVKDLYKTARRVKVDSKGDVVALDQPDKPIGRKELIYQDEYNICHTKAGTIDRPCSIDAAMKKITHYPYCKDLCCGNGNNYRSRPAKLIWECQCKFKWCCEVKCKQCSKEQVRYTCTK